MNYNNALTSAIYNLLAPVVGDMLAKSTLRVQCKHMGISEEAINISHLPALAKNIEKGLVLLLGSDKARQLSKLVEELNR